MSIKQISVFLENRPGKLQQMCVLLSEHNIDLRALSVAETQDFGIARMIVDDAYATANLLKENDFIARFTPVLAYAVPDEPGGLSRMLTAFSAAGVNIEYMYAFLGGRGDGKAYMIFRVADPAAAEGALAKEGFQSLTQDEIEAI